MTTDTIDETTLVMTRLFDATPAQVFDAWLQRDQFEAWIGPPGITCKVPVLEPKVGGRYRIDMKLTDGSMTPVGGVFKTIDRPERLVFTWGWDGDPARESLITLTFQARGDQTEMTLRQEGLGSVENRDGHENGWDGALGKLATYLAA